MNFSHSLKHFFVFYLISKTHIKDLVVGVGSQNRKTLNNFSKVRNIYIHERYNVQTKDDYDFVLLELEQPLIFSDKVKAIALPNIHETEVVDGTLCSVSGWGNTHNPNESEDVLRVVTIPIINRNVCKKSYNYYRDITTQMICAGDYEQGGKDCKKSLTIVI